MVWWLGILPVEGARVPSLVQEDPAWRRATKAMLPRACAPRLGELLQQGARLESGAHAPQLEEACTPQRRPKAAKNKRIKFLKEEEQRDWNRERRNCHVRLWVPAKLLPSWWVSATLWTVARQAPLSMGFSRQEYWSALPCPPPRDLHDPGIEPASGRQVLYC